MGSMIECDDNVLHLFDDLFDNTSKTVLQTYMRDVGCL